MYVDMSGLMGTLLSHGSYAVLFFLLVGAGFGLPIPEDIVLLAGGVLVHRGVTVYPVTLAFCFLGVLTGDIIIFNAAKSLGESAYSSRRFKKFLTPARRANIERFYSKHGGIVIFGARHLVGLRAPFFAMAAIHGMSLKRFVFWDTLALCITAPLVTGLGYYFSDRIDQVLRGVHHTEHYMLLAAVLALAAYSIYSAYKSIDKGENGE